MGEVLFADAANPGVVDERRCHDEVEEASRALLCSSFHPVRTTSLSIPHSDPEAMPGRRPLTPDKHAAIARTSLRGIMDDMMLPDRAFLAPSRKRYRDDNRAPYFGRGLVIGAEAVLNEVCISAGGATGPKTRFCTPEEVAAFKGDPDAYLNEESDGRVRVVWPNSDEWNGNVSVTLWYRQDQQRAGERISVVTCHDLPSELPAIESRVVLPVSGADIAFSRRVRPAHNEEEVSRFLDVVRQLHALVARP